MFLLPLYAAENPVCMYGTICFHHKFTITYKNKLSKTKQIASKIIDMPIHTLANLTTTSIIY